MKISFIEPKPKFAGWSFGWVKALPFLGQVYLATILRNRGHDVEILKEILRDIDFSKMQDTDIFCFSAMTSQAVNARRLMKEVKHFFPNKKVIVGGVHASFRPQDFPEADHIIIGEGENVISDLVEGRIKERIIRGRPVENLDKLPFPDHSLMKGLEKTKIKAMSSSRGCPFDCNFCTVTQMFGRKWRFRSPDSVIRELQLSKNAKKVIFYDDNFYSDKERAKEILRKMIDTGTTPPWWAEGRVDIAKDDELLKLISESNNIEIAVGFESLNTEVLNAMKKGQKFEDVIKCVKKLRDFGIKIKGFFIAGNDEDDKDAFEQINEFVDKHELRTAGFSIITPFPGTSLYEDFEKNSRILTKDWGSYDAQHVVFKPKKMTAAELQEKQYEALKKHYWTNLRWMKYWFENFSDTINMYKEMKRGAEANRQHLEFLRKVDVR